MWFRKGSLSVLVEAGGEGRREGGKEGGREGRREGRREGGRGGREGGSNYTPYYQDTQFKPFCPVFRLILYCIRHLKFFLASLIHFPANQNHSHVVRTILHKTAT